MKFWNLKPGEEARVRLLDIDDNRFCLSSHLINHKHRHHLTVLTEDGQVRILSLPSSSAKEILRVYRDQMERDRLLMLQREAARRFKQSRMKYHGKR